MAQTQRGLERGSGNTAATPVMGQHAKVLLAKSISHQPYCFLPAEQKLLTIHQSDSAPRQNWARHHTGYGTVHLITAPRLPSADQLYFIILKFKNWLQNQYHLSEFFISQPGDGLLSASLLRC